MGVLYCSLELKSRIRNTAQQPCWSGFIQSLDVLQNFVATDSHERYTEAIQLLSLSISSQD